MLSCGLRACEKLRSLWSTYGILSASVRVYCQDMATPTKESRPLEVNQKQSTNCIDLPIVAYL